MKILLHRNYAKVTVDASQSGSYVSVLLASNKSEHFRYNGFITQEEANNRLLEKSERGFFAAFFGSVGWKHSEMESWEFTGYGQYGVAYIEQGAFVVTEKGKPLLWAVENFSSTRFPVYHPGTAYIPPNNVVSLF